MKIAEMFKGIIKGLRDSLKRFPVTIGFSTACVITLIVKSEMQPITDFALRDNINRLAMIFALGVPLSLSIKLLFERKGNAKKGTLILLYLLGAAALYLYYLFLLKDFKMVPVTRYVGVSLILYLTFLFTPYLPGKDGFELYIIKIFTRFFTTIIYSAVLYGGLSAILFALDRLLEIKIQNEFYYYTWLFVAGDFAPTFFLAGIPLRDAVFTEEDYPKLFKVLILYIVMPLLTAYTIILYIYFTKIIVTQTWPKGLVSHLVLWYSVITSAVLFFISPVQHEKAWPRRFMQVFPKLLLPLLVMMFISIGIRVNQYGITENRYYVILLGIWTFLIMSYFSFSKKLRNIILPLSLALITFISVIGPVSSYSISKYSQNKRLKTLLIKNNMMQDNMAVKSSGSVTEDDARNISSIIRYFNYNHNIEEIKYLPKDFKIENMETVLGIKPVDDYFTNNNEYFFFRANGGTAIDIRGYDYLLDVRNSAPGNSNSPFSLSYDYSSNTINIKQDGKNIYSKDISEFTKGLVNKYGMFTKEQAIDPSELSFEDESDRVKIKVQFIYLSGNRNSSSGNIKESNGDFFVLIKVK